MVYYSHSIITKIKAAANEADLREIIDLSLQELPAKRSNGVNTRRSFILNMIMALKYAKAEGLPASEAANVDRAIEILGILRRVTHENLF